MPNFSYKARNPSGKLISGSMEATSEKLVAERLASAGYFVTTIKEEKAGSSAIKDFLARLKKVKVNDLVMFNLQLANMIGAGISLPMAVDVLAEQIENPTLKEATISISKEIKAGSTFSESLRKHPKLFNHVMVNMIQAGEATGNLEEILNRLAIFSEHEADIRQKISGAMTYPIVLTVLGVTVTTYTVGFVLPTFAKIFIESGVTLPLPTLILYNIGNFIRAFWYLILLAVIGGVAGFKYYANTPQGQWQTDVFKLKIPVWGNLIRTVAIGRFARTLSTLIQSGVPLLQAIELVEKTIDSAPIAKVMETVKSSVSKGEPISKALKESGQFPTMPCQMITVGEESGSLDKMLVKIADFYDLSAEYAIKKVSMLLEPVFLVVIGGLVGFIFASIIMPMFNMVKTLKTG